jgi:sucrose-phosphate synthase
MKDSGVVLLLISVHGLIRGTDPELGRDPDTGGQVLYVLELARALARQENVAQVDLLTRMVEDAAVGPEYACPEEVLADHARIIRLPFGPRRYIRKELLWDHLDHLVDRYLDYARALPRLPDLIHSHYADAGHVASRLSALLGIPFVHTGHSLGRCKLARMLEAGGKLPGLERSFHFGRRIEAEEETLRYASRVLASTRQEIRGQYGLYSHFSPRRAVVVPPGTDTSRFAPPGRRGADPGVAGKVDRFLAHARRPVVLCIGRPVPSKNLLGLVRAFADPELRARANLVLLAGSHEDIADLDAEGRATWEELLRTLDRLDLFGSVAFPRNHLPAEVPEFYRLAVARRGIYANPSTSEGFGLTLIEAAASGLPVVTTDSGGPRDIVANCRNGLVVEPADDQALAAALKEALAEPARWAAWSRNGLRGVRNIYTWDAHVRRYLKVVAQILRRERKRRRRERVSASSGGERSPFLHSEGVLVCDLDGTLLGDRPALERFLDWIRGQGGKMAFGVATGRKLESAQYILREWGMPAPDVVISGIGTEIRYGRNAIRDLGWEEHIRRGWRREDLAAALRDIPGLALQGRRAQGPFKLSYHVRPGRMPGLGTLQEVIHRAGLQANLVYSQGRHLDILPRGASKGQAVRYLAFKWGIALDHVLTAGDSGNDRDMLLGDMLGIVVANHSPELAPLRGRARVYFAASPFAGGVLEGIRHYALRYPYPAGDDAPHCSPS